jgi:hypothetical protein
MLMEDQFWDDCLLTGRDPEMVHGVAVLRDEHGNLTRLPVDTLVENVEAFMELDGLTEDRAIEATVEQFPNIHGGKDTLRALLMYQLSRLPQLQP